MKFWHIATLLALAGGALAFAPAAPTTNTAPAKAPAADDGEVYRTLLKDKGEAVVTIKYVMKDEDQQAEDEVQGVIIEDSGLILTSNYFMGGIPEAYKQSASNRKPLEIKVMISGDPEGVPATLVARDSELDLAWVQITNPDNKKFPAVDISKPAEPKLGDRLVTIERLTKMNDHAHVVNESRVRAIVSKPRKLFVPGTELNNSLGMPVFSGEGQFVGVMALQLPSSEEMEATRFSQFARIRQLPGIMLLPGADVVKATAAAKEQIKSGKPADEEPAAAPAEPAGPAGPGTPTPVAPTEEKKETPKQ